MQMRHILSYILILLSSSIFYCPVECVTEYWVRPTAVSSCPPSVSREQCVTITDLVSNTTNSSINGCNNVSVYFLPGVHIPIKEGWIVFGKINNDFQCSQPTAYINGITNETKEDSLLTLIDCKNESAKISLLFLHFFSLSLNNLEIRNCGFYIPRQEKVNAQISGTAAAICVINTPDVSLSYVSIKNSFGLGLILIDTDDEYTTWKIDNLNIRGNLADKGTQKLTGLQGNVLLLISSDIFSKRISTSIHVTNSQFSNGSGNCFQNNLAEINLKVRSCTSGGLALIIDTVKQDIDIEIVNCSFIGNQAVIGGGMLVKIEQKEPYRYDLGKNSVDYQWNRIPDYLPSFNWFSEIYEANLRIFNALFTDNTAILNGGGLYLSKETSISFKTQENSQFTVQNTSFIENNAKKSGGAIFMIRYFFKIKECFFFKNIARSGIAVYSSYHQSKSDSNVISSSNFSNHKSEYSLSNNRHNSDGSVIDIQNQEKLHLSDVMIINNTDRGLYLFETSLQISRLVIIENNYAQLSDGGGILFDCSIKITKSVLETNNMWYLALDEGENFNKLILRQNRADGVGGGIAIKESCGFLNSCFIVKRNEPTNNSLDLITMVDNNAKLGGDSIYGGNLKDCSFDDGLFDIVEMNTSSAISSPPREVCICSTTDFPQTHKCSQTLNIRTFPGQMFQVPLVCVGQLNYSSPCIVRADLSNNSKVKNIASIADSYTLRHLGLQCEMVSYTIDTLETEFTVSMFLMIQDSITEFNWEKQLTPAIVNVWIEACLPGFIQDRVTGQCVCTEHLLSKGVTCSTKNGRFYKGLSMWVGAFGGHVTAHQVCPFDYCKNNVTSIDPRELEEQCDFNRTGVLCGGCPPGFSLVLGTSQCKECSNNYLLLFIPFALIGIVLIIFLLKCNLTVSTGTINGLIFYANIVHATKTAFFSANSTNKVFRILSVFIAWLNLDLGLETCFIDGLNAYYRTWLQFVFPLYIWGLVCVLIVTSRYSITVSKWTGSNIVSVLATLFLLSYAKLLRTTLDIFSSTSLTNENGTTFSLWLLDGSYTFLEWPHSLLFIAGLVALIGHILPFTILLLLGPVLQRYSHHRPLHWVNKLMPLLDAYQGPYNKNFRSWSGFLLLVRLVILLAVALNVAGNQAINLFVINIVLSGTLLTMMMIHIKKIYRKILPNILEQFFLGNLLIFTMASQFLLSNTSFKISNQDVLTICMVGTAFAVCIAVLLYHCYNVCLKYECFKNLQTTITAFFLTLKESTPDSALDQNQLNNVNVPSTPTQSTVSIADLQEPLLDSDTLL